MAGGEHLVLDPQIRNWVVLPMVAMMVLMGIIRHFFQLLIKSEQVADKTDIQHRQTLSRVQRLRTNGKFVDKEAFMIRKHFFIAKDTGLLRAKVKGGMSNPMMNPFGMIDMMKNNMSLLIPNMFMMTFISYFFSGFVLVKIPFPLTDRFKPMLQRGIELNTLDTSYVSSLSWYFLVMFGLRGFFKLVLGEDSGADEAKAMQMQMGMGMGTGMGFDAKQAFQQERESLEMVKHEWKLTDIEKRLLGRKYPVKSISDPPFLSSPIPREKSVHNPTPSSVGFKPTTGLDKKRRGKTSKMKNED